MKKKPELENHQFGIHPSIIYTLITAQASGIEKALLELVMNSIDAGAKRIDISVDRIGFEVRDDGRGFKDLKEIEQCFGILGLPHESGDSCYGRFRLGRMQTFGYAKTEWHTKNIKILVDLNISPETESYGYEVVEVDDYHQGCIIKGQFYHEMPECAPDVDLTHSYSMSPYDVNNAIIALAISVKYSPVDVFINGHRVNKRIDEVIPFSKCKHALFYLTPVKNLKEDRVNKINVYNKGIFAYTIDFVMFTGDIVSLTTLDLNMARNEAKSTCGIHRSIRNKLYDLSDELRASLEVVKSHKTEINQERFISAFWSKFLNVNGACFEDEFQFISTYSLEWFQTPANETVSLSEIWRYQSYKFIPSARRSRMSFDFSPFCFYSRDYLVKYGIDPSQLDQICFSDGFIPFELLPDSEFMMHLPETISFSLKIFHNGKFPEDLIGMEVSEKIDSSLNLNERYTKLLKLMLKVHLSLSAIHEYLLVGMNHNEQVSRGYGKADFNCDFYELKQLDETLEVEDSKTKSEKYLNVLADLIRDKLSRALNIVDSCVVFDQKPREIGYQFCEIIKSRIEFETCLELSPFQQVVLEQLKSIVSNHSNKSVDFFETSLEDTNIDDGKGFIVKKRKLYLASLENALGQTDAFNYLLIDVDYFKRCVAENKYLELYCLVAHELAHDSSSLSMVHGEVFHMKFQMNMSNFYRAVGYMEEEIAEQLMKPKNFKSKVVFEAYGASQCNVEYFLKKNLLKFKGRY